MRVEYSKSIERGKSIMLDDITGIKLKGANFENETKLQLFCADNVPQISVLYGKNGAGKSTISRAFDKVKGNEETEIEFFELIGKDGTNIEIIDDEKKNICVFNEKYIDQNIRLREDGLNTIVILGKRKELETEIESIESELKIIQERVDKQKEICENYSAETNINSPLYYLKEINKSLKGDENWAGRNGKINDKRTASQVRSETYKQFIARTPSKKKNELIADFSVKFKELEDAKNGRKIIDKQVNTNLKLEFDENKYLMLLAKKIEKPELSEREKFLLSYVSEKGHEQHTDIVKRYFNKKTHNICPFCLQEVTGSYKNDLFASIEKILSKEAEKHQEELRKCKLQKVEYEFEAFRLLDSEAVERCESALNNLNDLISEINQNIEDKCTNVYMPIEGSSKNILIKFNNLLEALKELEKIRIEYNESASDVASKTKELNEINADIAYYDIRDNYLRFKKQLDAKQEEDTILVREEKKLGECKKKLQDLLEEKQNAKIALKFINDGLSYIFFAQNRLNIEYKDEQYILLSRNHPVTPKEISVGERNAIALCYFFSDIMRGRDETTIFTNKYLFVIDDPVSSFDMENRIGILSYLKYQMQRFSSGNAKTKILIMTHDIQTLYDIHKIAKEIISHCGGKADGKKSSLKLLELQNNSIDNFNIRDRNEYTSLMENIFEYAKEELPGYELVIGNSMRRLLEAFSTFVYKKGIEEISTDPAILGELEKPYECYFENLMYRLVLHGGSHYQDRIKALENLDFFDYISQEEKIRTAKDVLCFIYCLNPMHVLEHLKGKENVEYTIKAWLEGIKAMGVE